MNKLLLPLVLSSVCLFLFGCETDNVGPNTTLEVTRILGDIQSTVKEVQVRQDELAEVQNARVKTLEDTAQFVSDRAYGAQYANTQNPASNGYTKAVNDELESAAKALPAPSPAAHASIVERLQHELSQSVEDRKLLENRNKELSEQALKLKGSNEELKLTVDAKETALKTATAQLSSNVDELAQKKVAIELAAKQAKDAKLIADSVRASKTRLLIASLFMGLGGIILTAAVVAGFMGVTGVLWPGLSGGGALLVFGWVITYVEDLLQMPGFRIAVGVVLLGLLVYLVYMGYKAWKIRKQHKLDAQISSSTIGAIQEVKNDDKKLGRSVFATLKPYLQEWHVRDDGTPDLEMKKEIDRRLVDMNLKNKIEPQVDPALASMVNK